MVRGAEGMQRVGAGLGGAVGAGHIGCMVRGAGGDDHVIPFPACLASESYLDPAFQTALNELGGCFLHYNKPISDVISYFGI